MLSEKTTDQMPLPWLPLPTTQSSLSDVARQIYDGSSFDQEWKDLRFIPWRFFYLDYHHLQKDIVYGNIAKRLETEWSKVYEFYILKRGEIERRIKSIKTTRKEQELKTLVIDIHQLYHFAKLNYCGFLRLFMQYDRLFGSNTASDLLRRLLINKPFWDHSIVLFGLANSLNSIHIDQKQREQDPISVQINVSNQSFFSAVENMPLLRKKKQVYPLSSSSSSCTLSTMNSCETALSSQLDFPKHEKTIKKYWVHPDNIVEVMLFMSTVNKMVLQDKSNNPSSTYSAVDEVGHPQGIKSKLAEKSTQSIHHIKTNTSSSSSSRLKVTTTYMDTVDLNDYTDRIIRKPIKTTRVRKFESKEEEKQNTYISLEQKVYYNGQQNHTYKGHKGFGKEPQQNYDPLEQQHDWVQQRVWFKSKHLEQWLNGDYSISNVLDKPSCQYRTDDLPTITTRDKYRMENTCLQMQNELHNKIKTPTLKTTQYRTVYTSDKVTVSIDTDISISSGKDDMRFPYCIVQVEQSSQPEEPDWISSFTSNAMLEPVHDFSLYLHGVGTLLYDRVHVFPSWFSKMEILDIRHTGYRGSLLFVEEEEKPALASLRLPVVASRSRSSTDSDKQYWSSNTIATIVTCYEDEIKHVGHSSSPLSLSSSSSSSSLLSPVSKQEGKLRRSFDSYCSFDHPTSSKSDPTNCKSCMGKLNQEHHMFASKKTGDDTERVTFFSVLKNVIQGFHQTTGEKEPLLCNKQDAATQIRHHGYFMGVSRATVITTSCVFTSFIVSYLLYIFILKIK